MTCPSNRLQSSSSREQVFVLISWSTPLLPPPTISRCSLFIFAPNNGAVEFLPSGFSREGTKTTRGGEGDKKRRKRASAPKRERESKRASEPRLLGRHALRRQGRWRSERDLRPHAHGPVRRLPKKEARRRELSRMSANSWNGRSMRLRGSAPRWRSCCDRCYARRSN